MPVALSIFSLPPTNPNKTTQHNLRHDTPKPLKPLPLVLFTLPDRSVLLVGASAHLTGELTFPHKASPVSAYFLPDSDVHSLLGISPLIRPHGVAIFTPTSVTVFDTPTSTTSPHSDLWFFTAPRPSIPSSPSTALFSLNSLPLARFVAYHHHSFFGSPPISTFLRALSRGYINGIPKLTATLVRKFPPLSLATSYGHLTHYVKVSLPRVGPHLSPASIQPISPPPLRCISPCIGPPSLPPAPVPPSVVFPLEPFHHHSQRRMVLC
jgi:hypothetical protein